MAESDTTSEAAELDELSKKFFTTKQVASLLHVKERKIYELASAGEIPGTRALGKWLFDRNAIYSWLKGHGTLAGTPAATQAPNVVLGSHDALLEWALREANSGLATFMDGSIDGLERFAVNEGIAAGLHIFDQKTRTWNVPAIASTMGSEPIALVEWAWRERGILVAPGNPKNIRSIEDLTGKSVAPRQEKAGSQVLLQQYLAEEFPKGHDIHFIKPTRSENDTALAVRDGDADAAFGLKCTAHRFQLDFVPVLKERYDLLLLRREWFEPPLQRLFAFARTEEFQAKAASLTGYDISGLGKVHFNGS